MAGDADIQSALQTLIQALSRYQSDDVTLSDFRVMGSGRAVCVITPGPMRSESSGDWAQRVRTWTHYLHLWRPFPGDDVSDIVADRQAVIETLDAHPTLDGETGVAGVTMESSELQWLWPAGAPPNAKPSHVGFRIEVTTLEEWSADGSGEFA